MGPEIAIVAVAVLVGSAAWVVYKLGILLGGAEAAARRSHQAEIDRATLAADARARANRGQR